MPDHIPGGTRVRYVGAVSALQGEEMTYLYANQCNCKHQTYVLERDNGKRLEKVLRESFVIIQPAPGE